MGQYSFEWLCDYESNNLPHLYDPVELPPNQIMYKLRTCKLFLEWSFLVSNKVNLLSQVYSAISGTSVTLVEEKNFIFSYFRTKYLSLKLPLKLKVALAKLLVPMHAFVKFSELGFCWVSSSKQQTRMYCKGSYMLIFVHKYQTFSFKYLLSIETEPFLRPKGWQCLKGAKKTRTL